MIRLDEFPPTIILIVCHYDVEINPVVKVANQKKPRQLLWEVWLQLVADAAPDLKKALEAGAYDMV